MRQIAHLLVQADRVALVHAGGFKYLARDGCARRATAGVPHRCRLVMSGHRGKFFSALDREATETQSAVCAQQFRNHRFVVHEPLAEGLEVRLETFRSGRHEHRDAFGMQLQQHFVAEVGMDRGRGIGARSRIGAVGGGDVCCSGHGCLLIW
ncbi:hypothetical protein D9M68_682410 [compost metagenome]